MAVDDRAQRHTENTGSADSCIWFSVQHRRGYDSQSVCGKKQHPGVFALPADTLCNNVSWIQHEEALPTLENDIRTTTFPDAPYIKKKPMFCLIYVKKHQAIKSEIFTGHKYLGCDV